MIRDNYQNKEYSKQLLAEYRQRKEFDSLSLTDVLQTSKFYTSVKVYQRGFFRGGTRLLVGSYLWGVRGRDQVDLINLRGWDLVNLKGWDPICLHRNLSLRYHMDGVRVGHMS